MKELSEESEPDLRDEIANATTEVYINPSTETAAALFEASMYAEHALVRVAAAAGARETTRLRKAIRRTLEEGCRSEDSLVAGVAQEAMLRIDRHNPHVRAKMGERTKMTRRSGKSRTAVVDSRHRRPRVATGTSQEGISTKRCMPSGPI
jgi:hypothetical protein